MKTALKQLTRKFSSTVKKGNHFEKIARAYLARQGLKNFEHNFRSRYGEIDLIANDHDTLVFIEVRYRSNADHGTPAETVQFAKQIKIIRTARYFLQKRGLTNRMPCRFDVIGISGPTGNTEIHWIKNAF